MSMTRRVVRAAGVVGACVAVVASALATATPAGAATRGFDGTTIKVAGLGIQAQAPLAETGARARIERFNKDQELKGVKIDYVEFADDKQDAATALSEARRLVTQDGVFAIVGDVSANNPADYFAQQHVPYFGGGWDSTYCSPKPSTKLWAFGPGGCITPTNPSFVGDTGQASYKYVTSKAGSKTQPVLDIVTNDTESGKNTANNFVAGYKGAGFKVLPVDASIPQPSPSDYTPYSEKVLTSNNGKAPDAVLCLTTLDCVGLWDKIKASGFSGTYLTGLYSDALVKAMSGSVAQSPFVNPNENTPAIKQLKTDMDAVDPGSSAKVDNPAITGYNAADMFIQAVKTAAKKGTSNITPENVQKAASKMTWKIDGLAGPVQYPKATVYTYPLCTSLYVSDGATWTTAVPFACYDKTYKP
jgi:ABC-type branched-subunit amino acid transport system substrate-binding protein